MYETHAEVFLKYSVAARVKKHCSESGRDEKDWGFLQEWLKEADAVKKAQKLWNQNSWPQLWPSTIHLTSEPISSLISIFNFIVLLLDRNPSRRPLLCLTNTNWCSRQRNQGRASAAFAAVLCCCVENLSLALYRNLDWIEGRPLPFKTILVTFESD